MASTSYTPRGAPGTPFAPLSATDVVGDYADYAYFQHVGKLINRTHETESAHIRADPMGRPILCYDMAGSDDELRVILEQNGHTICFGELELPTQFMPAILVTEDTVYAITREGGVYQGDGMEAVALPDAKFGYALGRGMETLSPSGNAPFRWGDFPDEWHRMSSDSARLVESLGRAVRLFPSFGYEFWRSL